MDPCVKVLFTICMKIKKEVQPPCFQKLLDQQNSPYESQELGGKFLNYITATKTVATFIHHSSTDQQQTYALIYVPPIAPAPEAVQSWTYSRERGISSQSQWESSRHEYQGAF